MKKDRRKMILIAAEGCFAKYGYKKTTLEDIGKIIGISKPAIYYYFKSKAEIYITMATNKYNNLIYELNEEVGSWTVCEDKIHGYFEKRLDWLFNQSNILNQISQDELRFFNEYGSETVANINKKERKLFTNILKKCIEDKVFQDFEVDRISSYIFILVDGIYSHHRASDDVNAMTQDEMDNIKNEVSNALDIFLNGLKN